MKVEKVTLPLMATLFLSGNGVALAGSASPLDPYAYIQAPTREQKEAMANKGKKKVKKLVVKEKAAAPAPIQQARSTKPASVIISESSPKFDDEKESKPAKTTTASASPSSDEGTGFLAGIKQSTSGIAKSTKAASSGMVNGTKAVGSKIAEGFKSTGEKVKEGTAAAGEKMAVVPKKIGEGFKSTGEKVKEGSSSVGEKLAGGFGALGAIPKAMGGAASKTGDGAKKLAAAPAAGFGAIGHGFSKMNPFHKDEAPVATAQKTAAPSGPKQSLVKEELQTAKAPVDGDDAATGAANGADNVADSSAEKTTPVAETPAVKAPTQVAAKPEKAKAQAEKIAKKEGGLKDRLAAAPKAGIGATRAGLDKTKAGVGAISHGFTKLNPFHKGGKADEIPAPATAQKPVEQKPINAEPAAPEVVPPQLGERIVVPDEDNAPPVKVAPTNDAVGM